MSPLNEQGKTAIIIYYTQHFLMGIVIPTLKRRFYWMFLRY